MALENGQTLGCLRRSSPRAPTRRIRNVATFVDAPIGVSCFEFAGKFLAFDQ